MNASRPWRLMMRHGLDWATEVGFHCAAFPVRAAGFLCGALVLALSGAAFAADVPPGTRLAAKQEIVIGNGSDPTSLDPAKGEGNVDYNLYVSLFEGLVGLDANGKPVPGVAEKWESRDGGRTWLFHLRKSARWSDGTPLTAADFEFAWRRTVDPKTASPTAWYLSQVCNILNAEAISAGKMPATDLGIKAVNGQTLQITLEQPVSILIAALTHPAMFPVPRRVLEQHGERWTDADKLVGNGPFRITHRVVNERIDMVRNPHYWNNARTVIDKASFLAIAQTSAEYQRYRANAIDLTSSIGVPHEHLPLIRKEIGDELLLWPRLATYFYVFNTRRPPFDDVRVRRALALAVNRDVLTRQILQGGQLAAYSMTPAVTDAYQHRPLRWETASQPERDAEARRLLIEAGYSAAKPLKFPLLYNTSEQHKKIALAVASMWKRIGAVDVELVNQEWKTYLDARSRGEFAVVRAGWGSNINDPQTMLGLFHSAHGNNDGRYRNPEFDALIDRAKVHFDPAERVRLFQAAEALLAEDAPAAMLYHDTNLRLVKPWIKGYGRDPSGYIQVRDLYLLER